MGYSKLDLRGKSAVVMGGPSGIGRAIALGLAEAGADVAPTSRRVDQVESTAREVEALGRRLPCLRRRQLHHGIGAHRGRRHSCQWRESMK
jgi:NAD(P)-dependent dehydrogenase (short-subunit alcohol dehydrogenase family)